MVTYRVADGTQVLHEEILRLGGETFSAEADEMADAVAAGWVVEVKPKRAKRAR